MKNKQDNSKMLQQYMLSQQFQQIQQQIYSLEEQTIELEHLKSSLESLKNQKKSNNFSSLGGGIFVESEIKESNNVLLNVGANVFVKKSKDESIKLIKNQIEQLLDIKEKLQSEINKLNLDLVSLR